MTNSPRQFTSDEELQTAIIYAHNNKSNIHIFIDTLPSKFPPATKEYLYNMADPAETETYTLVSFYNFIPVPEPEIEKTVSDLRELWSPFRVVGRVYIATEGINAQMAIPTNILHNFKLACNTCWLLYNIRLNTDHTITKEEYTNNKPFKGLHIRIREQIVTDGLEGSEPLIWEKSGREMPPLG